MTDDFNKKKQESLGRWGTALTACMIIIGGFAALLSSSFWIGTGLLFSGFGLLWFAFSASPEVAVTLGKFLPLS